MTRQIINVGVLPNDGTGDSIRIAFGKVNNNFAELYSASSIPTFSESVFNSYTTASTTELQPLYSIPANTCVAIDFAIISQDPTGNSVQITKLNSVILGTTVNYTEVDTRLINGMLGDYSVGYDTEISATPQVVLYVTPTRTNTITHRVLATVYYS